MGKACSSLTLDMLSYIILLRKLLGRQRCGREAYSTMRNQYFRMGKLRTP
jgi:hypothetical protein